MKKRIAIRILLGLLVVGAGVGVYLKYFRTSKKDGPRYETVTVDRGAVVARLMASGTLSPLVTVQVGSQVSGRIKSLFVDFNSTVKKGQVIARIDPQLFDAALEQGRANLLAAEANLAKAQVQSADAERQYKRSRSLATRNLVAPADADTSQANAEASRAAVRAAQAAVAQARASLNQARVNLAYTTIVSPIDGVVISRNVDVGQTVAASLQAPTLFTIAEDLAKMQVHANVAEADIGRIRNGMVITFSVDAYPREQFKGVVQQVRNSPQTLQNVVTYDVVVNVDNPDLRLKPGMTANVTFVYAESDEVLRVPNAALRFRPPPALLAKLREQGIATGFGKKGGKGGKSDKAGGSPGAGGLAHGKKGGQGGKAEGSPGAGGLAHGKRGSKGSKGGKGEEPAEATAAAAATAPASQAGQATQASGRGPSDVRQVWVLRDGQPRPASIHVGISDGSLTEVLSGPIKEGDEVITDVSGLEAGGGGAGGPPGTKGMGPPRGRGIVRHL